MKIRDVLAAKGARVVTAWPTKRLDAILKLFDDNAIASVVIVDPDNRLLGMITDRVVMRVLARQGVDVLKAPAGEVMTSPVPTCRLDDGVSEVLRVMTDNRFRHLVAEDQGRMVGIVSIGDLVQVRLDDAEIEGRVLRDRALSHIAVE